MIDIRAVIPSKIGFVSHQNAVSVIADLEINVFGDEDIQNAVLSLTSNPTFIEPKTWIIDRLTANSSLRINDRVIKLDGGMLAALTESAVGEIKFSLSEGENILGTAEFAVEYLARTHWGGAASMPELLAAFCTPNDPAVDKILKGASDILRRAGENGAINGYADATRNGPWKLASAIWSSVAAFKLSYALPPASFEDVGQKIRTPSVILDGRLATCLDTSLLFAACFEQAGLHPILVLTKGHAFAGVWLQNQQFPSLLTEEAEDIRKRVDLKDILIFETTLVTNTAVPSFSAAIAHAVRQMAPELDADFVLAVDVHRSRMQRIKPVSLGSSPPPPRPDEQTSNEVPAFEVPPPLPPIDVETASFPETPKERVALWQRKLLDLTTRNRLLHVPDNAKAITLLCQDPGSLEDKLAGGQRIKISLMPDLSIGGRDIEVYNQQTVASLTEQVVIEALAKGEVLCSLDKTRLDAMLTDLYRTARTDLDEGGANTLFLALGFLKWKKSADDARAYRAPLILLPIKLDRKSALSGIVMTQHEDEPRFNLTLLELLRQDFSLNIAELDGPLPSDESGIDVSSIWNTVRRAVRDVPGFEVVGTVMLGTFSFGKYLMWKDLADRAGQLTQSPVVKHLIERGADRFQSRGQFPRPSELDRVVDPSKLFAPLPADSSQLAAVIASANLCDFVLDGPPGTGKSQTIANMIAHNLAMGRRVLFVAEKMAALSVVYRRLEEKGLGEFCLELHSNKTSKTEVLKQLERAWDTRDQLSPEAWAQEASNIRRLRDSLNDLVKVLHSRRGNGMTLHHAIGMVVRYGNDNTPPFSWPEETTHDENTMIKFRDLARRIGIGAAQIVECPHEFVAIKQLNWSNAWQAQIVEAAGQFPKRLETLIATRGELIKETNLPLGANDNRSIQALCKLVAVILKTYGLEMKFAFSSDYSDIISSVAIASGLITDYRSIEGSLSVKYSPDLVPLIELDVLETYWANARKKFWFFATRAKKEVANSLGRQGGAVGSPIPEIDFPKLRRLQQLRKTLEEISSRLNGVPGWALLHSDVGKMAAAIKLADELRHQISSAASGPEHLVELGRAISGLVIEANELLAPQGAISRAFGPAVEALSSFSNLLGRMANLTGNQDLADNFSLNALAMLVAPILTHQSRLNAWCAWQRVVDEAVMTGLLPLVKAIEAGAPCTEATHLFEVAYARWFADRVIDAEPTLTKFVSDVHMNDIEAYRSLDDRISKLTVRYIRAQLCGQIPDKNAVGKKDGYGVLKHQLQLQRRHKPIRQLAIEMGDALTRLAPCMLMSPLSIAQYLPPDQSLFDLVIFDEASQIAPWDAIGSIARGRQVVIAGDPRQMPPTSFFGRSTAGSDNDGGTEEDMESILDECLGAGLPQHSLDWHYRSQHESLIAFSNSRYYENRLITFPAPVTRNSAVSWRRVDGVYAKGKSRTNQVEAEAMVAETLLRLTDPAFVASGKTVGIIVLNADQQKLIEDLLDRERQKYPAIERFFGDSVLESVFVKNLETVQGDERDLILLGIGYGPTEPGSSNMSMNFGPLNRNGGWRRLNVAITRARAEMVLFTSFDAGMVDLNRTSANAVRDLKHFIEFAERGPRALAEAVRGSMGGFESPFEAAVAEALMRKGWKVVTQIGVSSFRIDLGIVHPDRPGDYLVGVECDGATYHSAATARDRDKVRQAILTTLGWKLLRVWSTDWWVDKSGAIERLHTAITSLLEADRTQGDGLSAAKRSEPANELPEPTFRQDTFARHPSEQRLH